MLHDKVFRLLIEKKIRIHELIPWSHPPGIIIPTPLSAGVRRVLGIVSLIRRNGHHSIFNVTIERIGRRAIRRHKRFIKSPFIWAIN